MGHRRLESLKELIVLQDKMERFYEEGASLPSAAQAWVPPVDMYETADEVVIRAEMPGMAEKEIKIEASGNYITLQGERKLNEGKQRYLRVERGHGPFQRTFRLPVAVRPDGVRAEYRRGVLTVTILKCAGPENECMRVEIE